MVARSTPISEVLTVADSAPGAKAYHPPAIAPTIDSGSFPDTTTSGSGVSGGTLEKSSSQAEEAAVS